MKICLKYNKKKFIFKSLMKLYRKQNRFIKIYGEENEPNVISIKNINRFEIYFVHLICLFTLLPYVWLLLLLLLLYVWLLLLLLLPYALPLSPTAFVSYALPFAVFSTLFDQ